MLAEKINELVNRLVQEFDAIAPERKQVLEQLTSYVQAKKNVGETAQLMYVCTHNSRRSHFGQIWSEVAAQLYGVGVETYSGGTEATAFHPNAIAALRAQGFEIQQIQAGENPHYAVWFGDGLQTVCFSKVVTDVANPSAHFAAIMTCSEADENCPFIPGADLRVATTYDDPKMFDNTPLATEKYQERSLQIAREVLYCYSKIQ